MKRLVLIACFLGQHSRHVHPPLGAPSIVAATGLRPEQAARLGNGDCAAIERAMQP